MKILSSFKSAKLRDSNCKIVKRGKKMYIVNKKKPKFKARQG